MLPTYVVTRSGPFLQQDIGKGLSHDYDLLLGLVFAFMDTKQIVWDPNSVHSEVHRG